MRQFLDCCVYLIIIGLAGFLVGRVLPKEWFCFEQFPYHTFDFEKAGRIYTILGVRDWKDKVPDMSNILSSVMPSKKLPKKVTDAHLVRMIQETCVAEFIHLALCIVGLRCLWIWDSVGGLLVALLNILGNLPYIIIQRYNRPRLVRLLESRNEKYAGRSRIYACTNP